jgi:IS30 family transposase
MANWPQFQVDADIHVYFCNPHSPWKPPSNEHTNGLPRQYLPRGIDLNRVSLEQVQFVAAEMNGRPREVFDWRTPAEEHADVIAMAS